MQVRLLHLWDTLRVSYWFVPVIMALCAVGLALFFLTIDAAVPDEALKNSPFLYVAEADAERNLLLSVGTVTLGTAGVVFSLTTVPLTVAASQFGSRLLRNFLRDHQTQIVLGTYFATFIYCMIVLFSVPNEPAGQSLPHISATVSLILALVSLCLLIFFIHHIAISLQAPTVIAEVGEELQQVIRRFTVTLCMVPDTARLTPEKAAEQEATIRTDGIAFPAIHTGYVHTVDLAGLTAFGEGRNLILLLEHQPGDFIVAGDTLGFAWPPEEIPHDTLELSAAVSAFFILGSQRIPTEDVEFAVNQLVEVAVRALSPAINDPFTAMTCLDRLAVSLRMVAQAPPGSRCRYDRAGHLRVIHPVFTLERLTSAAFHLIRQYGRGNAEVLIRLLDAISIVMRGTSRETDRNTLLRHAELVRQEAESAALPNPQDRARVRDHYHRVFGSL